MSRMLKVASAVPIMTVQDFGRSGWQRYGLSESGAMDRIALHEGAALLGDDPNSAVIEMYRLGGRFEAERGSFRIAMTGAPMQASINGAHVTWNASHWLEEGSILEIGKARDGVYGYLRIAGGIETPPQLGARSTHLRSGIGGFQGRPLKSDDKLTVGDDPGGPVGRTIFPYDRIGRPVIRAVWGIHSRIFSKAERDRFQQTNFRVTPRMDRMGICLNSGSGPFQGANHLSIVSDAVVQGDVQVSGDGQPVVLMADRPTTGGYPRLATVISADLPCMAQLAPDEEFQFKIISVDEAVQLLIEQSEAVRNIRVGEKE